MLPYNALLLELQEVGKGTQNTLAAGYFMEQIYWMHFYCNEEDEIYWEPSWPPAQLQSPLLSEDNQLNSHQPP